MPAPLALSCGYQAYDWGKPGNTSRVAELVGDHDPSKRFAELWIGTHPSKPAVLRDTTTSLKSLFEADTPALLGDAHAKRFGADVPFLLKVLSIDKALSIQAHPAKDHAVKLHAADPKNYPDANHKPELVVALTPFQALCCFRPVAEVKGFVAAVPQLQALLKESSAAIAGASRDTEKAALRAALTELYATDAKVVGDAVDARAAALSHLRDIDIGLADRVFLRIQREFPRDVGCFMVYFLNVVNMSPGDGLFMAPNEPHSYLQGDCVEIMASSDNVVRAGLTPKFKDVAVLLDMLTYRTDALEGVSYTCDPNAAVQTYAPPEWCDEFSLTVVRLSALARSAEIKLSSASLAVVVNGSVTIAGTTFSKGATFAVPVGIATGGFTATLSSTEPAQVYFGATR